MIFGQDSGQLVLGIITCGLALTFYLADRRSATSPPLSLSFASIGFALLVPDLSGLWLVAFAGVTLEALAMLAGVEFGRRVGRTAARGRLRTATQVLFRVGQVLIIVFWFLAVGYLIIAPDHAMADRDGFIALQVIELAVFVPILSVAMVCVMIAIILLLAMRVDRAEGARLHALLGSGPFMLAALMVNDTWVPLTLSIGLVIFLAGSVRYLIVQGQRGQFMGQFLSPAVARMVADEGLERALRQEQREISVVVGDLRGFTAYARQHSSADVVDLLERFYAEVGRAAAAHGGTIKDHAGDGLLILVGAPLPLPDHAEAALRLAEDARDRVAALLQGADVELGVGFGVATGPVTVGAIQGAGRLEYVAVGNPVNLAARLCDRAADGEILMDTATRDAIDEARRPAVDSREPVALKGYAEPVSVLALGASGGAAG